MSEKSSRNAGIRLIGNFTDQAMPLAEGAEGEASQDAPQKAGRSANAGVRLVADFCDRVQPLPAAKTNGEKLKTIAAAFLSETMTWDQFHSVSSTLDTSERRVLLDLMRRHVAESGLPMNGAQQEAMSRAEVSLAENTRSIQGEPESSKDSAN